MPFYGPLEAVIEYAPPVVAEAPNPQDGPDGKDSLEELLTNKVRCLADILADISRDITGRAKLSENVIHLIYQHYLYVKYHLLILEQWPIAGNRAIEQRRSGLEKQLDALLQEKRAEQVKCWQDVARLREEARRWFKQHSDLRERLAMVLGGEVKAVLGNAFPLSR